MARKIVSLLLSIMLLTSLSCQAFALEEAAQRPEEDPAVMLPAHAYALTGSVEVTGRQGVCAEGGNYWVSGSASLAKYDTAVLQTIIHHTSFLLHGSPNVLYCIQRM